MIKAYPLLLFLLLLNPAHLYNIDTTDPIKLRGPNDGEYFGYSAAIQKSGEGSWVLVGAPTANMTLSDGSVGERWGTVYNCSVEVEQCSIVLLDTQPPQDKEVKEGQWTGATLSTNPATYDAVACAHRYTKRGKMNTDNEVGMRGRCWQISARGHASIVPDMCTDLEFRQDDQCDRCSQGFSAVYDDVNMLSVGGVGYNKWMGRAMFYSTATSEVENPHLAYSGYFSRTYDYLGYSMASCLDRDSSMRYVFIGAPRSFLMKGKVDYIMYKEGSTFMQTSPLARGMSFGAYFGAAVTCGYTKLEKFQVIIGAPFWSDPSVTGDYNRGIVYIYEVNKYFGIPSFPRALIQGKRAGDRFGASLSVIGDINKDGYEDLAVGAPADLSPDAGRVYIYLGSSLGISAAQTAVQVLSATPTPGAPLYGFGGSVSQSADIDNNRYPDIVVGAFYSDTAFIYRTLPIVNINVTNSVPDLVDKDDICNNETVACFKLEFCASYKPNYSSSTTKHSSNLKVTNYLDIENTIPYTKRVRFADKTYNNTVIFEGLIYGENYENCSSIYVYLKEDITNIKQLISIKTEIEVVESPKFENRIAMNVSQFSYDISQVKIKTSCGNASCITDLILESTGIQFDKYDEATSRGVLYSGFNEVIWSNYTITRNTSLGKPFGSHLLITMPQSMYIIRVRDSKGARLSMCTPYSATEGRYYCGLDNKLDKNNTVTFSFSVEYSVSGVKNTKEVIVRTELKPEGSDDQNPDNNVLLQNTPVRKLSRLELSGTTSPATSTFQLTDSDKQVMTVSDIGGSVETTFLPVNMGPGQLDNLELKIEVPFALNTSQDFIYPYKVDSTTEVECSEEFLNVKNIPSSSSRSRRSAASPDSDVMSFLLAGDAGSQGVGNGGGDDKPMLPVKFECGATVHCINISCTVKSLSRDIVGIRLTSYVWEPSFETPMTIVTSVRGWVHNRDPGADLTSDSVTGPIVLPLKIVATASLVKPLSIWVLVGSACGGLCGLALLVIILYKCGFFERNRPPKAEFYANKPVETIEVVDHGPLETSCDISDDEDDGQFAFKNPMCDVEYD